MRLLLVDATACLFRAFHAAPDLRAKDGTPTGAVFVLANILAKLRRQWPSEFMACVMDAPGGTFRHEMFPDYKANRPPLDDDLRVQIAPAGDFIRAAGCPLLVIPDVEADDVIAALTLRAVGGQCEVVVASSDKDLMQLVGDRVQMVDGIRDKIYDADAVREKFGVAPAQMADYLALVGDSSDNIPGVKKVGAKTAAKWLNEFGGLQNLLKQSDQIKGVVGKNLREAAQDGTLDLSRRLVELKTDLDIGREWNHLTPQPPDDAKWRALCERYDFRNLTGAMREFSKPENNRTKSAPGDSGDSSAAPGAEAETVAGAGAESGAVAETESGVADSREFGAGEIVRDRAALETWVEKIRAAGEFAFDTETVGSTEMLAEIVGFSLAVGRESAYVPLAHAEDSPQIRKDEALGIVAPLFADPGILKIAHSAKFDIHVLANAGLSVAGTVEDTKVAAFARFAGDPTNLHSLAARHLGIQKSVYKEVADKKLYANFAEVPIARAAPYAASDAECAWRLRPPLIGGMDARERKVYRELDRPLIPVLTRMERAGVLVDAPELRRLAADMRKRMAELQARAREIAGERFNLNSTRQLATMLYDRGGAEASRITATGARSTDERALERLADDFPLAAAALEHRRLAKLTGTYAEKLPRMILPATGRVHTDFSQTGAVTGRLSSSAPNLQNIPIRTELGRRIRRAFAAPAGSVLISADYSQIELRLMAHISGDAALREAFARGADIHRRTAAEVFGAASGAEVSDEQRRAAKAINFGLMYGMSAFGLARGLKISQTQARHYMDLYFSRYPGVADYMARAGKESAGRGFSETIFGRRIPVSGRGGAAERAAINAPMQGGAADLMKRAMIRADEWLRKSGMRTRMLLQVHDELILESPLAEAEEAGERIRELMEGAAELSVPLAAEVRAGGNWDEAH